MKIEIELSLSDAYLVSQWLNECVYREIDDYVGSPRNHVLLFATLVREAIKEKAKQELKKIEG